MYELIGLLLGGAIGLILNLEFQILAKLEKLAEKIDET